jgi:exodeoxyribonuclease VIII
MNRRTDVTTAALMADDPDQPAAGQPRQMPKVVVMPPQPPRTPPPGLLPCPAPGIYPNIDFETYLSWDALNVSSLRKIAKTPRKFRNALDNPVDKHTDSKRFGTAFHMLCLEPKRFKTSVVPAPINPKTDKPYGMGTKAWDEYAANFPGKVILGADELTELATMKREIDAHPEASALLQADGQCEVALVWTDPTTGLRAKGRADKLIPRFGLIDIKTTQDASHAEFSRSIAEYGYCAQVAWYLRGLRELKKAGLVDAMEHFTFLTVETEEDHGVVVYALGEDSIKAGDAQVGEWTAAVAKCQAAGVWPSYETGVQQIEAPEWFLRRWVQGLE